MALIGMETRQGKDIKKKRTREVCCELGVDSRGERGKYVKRNGRGKRGNNGGEDI